MDKPMEMTKHDGFSSLAFSIRVDFSTVRSHCRCLSQSTRERDACDSQVDRQMSYDLTAYGTNSRMHFSRSYKVFTFCILCRLNKNDWLHCGLKSNHWFSKDCWPCGRKIIQANIISFHFALNQIFEIFSNRKKLRHRIDFNEKFTKIDLKLEAQFVYDQKDPIRNVLRAHRVHQFLLYYEAQRKNMKFVHNFYCNGIEHEFISFRFVLITHVLWRFGRDKIRRKSCFNVTFIISQTHTCSKTPNGELKCSKNIEPLQMGFARLAGRSAAEIYRQCCRREHHRSCARSHIFITSLRAIYWYFMTFHKNFNIVNGSEWISFRVGFCFAAMKLDGVNLVRHRSQFGSIPSQLESINGLFSQRTDFLSKSRVLGPEHERMEIVLNFLLVFVYFRLFLHFLLFSLFFHVFTSFSTFLQYFSCLQSLRAKMPLFNGKFPQKTPPSTAKTAIGIQKTHAWVSQIVWLCAKFHSVEKILFCANCRSHAISLAENVCR